MSGIRHGATLTVLLRQPEPSFRYGGAGEFDSMTRSFKCLKEDADAWIAQVLKLGTSDAVTLSIATGGTLAGYRNMFIVGHSVKRLKGDSALIEVSYSGLLGNGKIAAVEYDVGIEQQTVKFTNSTLNSTLYIPTRVNVPKPRITHTYIVLGGKPSILRAGIQKNPPGISPADTARLDAWYDNYDGGQVNLIEEWDIVSSNPKTPGNIMGIPLVQVKDVYEWTVVRVPATF